MRAFFHGDYEDITPEDNKSIYKLMDWLKEQPEGEVSYSLNVLAKQEDLNIKTNQQAINGMNVLLKNHDLDEIVFQCLYFRRKNRTFWGRLTSRIYYYVFLIKAKFFDNSSVTNNSTNKE